MVGKAVGVVGGGGVASATAVDIAASDAVAAYNDDAVDAVVPPSSTKDKDAYFGASVAIEGVCIGAFADGAAATDFALLPPPQPPCCCHCDAAVALHGGVCGGGVSAKRGGGAQRIGFDLEAKSRIQHQAGNDEKRLVLAGVQTEATGQVTPMVVARIEQKPE